MLLEKSCKLRRGHKQSDHFGRLRKFSSRQKPNKRTRQTRVFGEALRSVHHCHNSTTDLDRKTVSGKHFKTRNVLQSEFEGHEYDLRRLLVNVGRLGKKANYLNAKKQRLREA